MATITIKDIPEELYAALKEAASANHRSINREIIHAIEQMVRSRRVNAEEAIAAAQRLRVAVPPIDDGALTQIKREGLAAG